MSALDSTDVAIRPLVQEDAGALLRAILAAGDYGVLLTDLEHRSLACNRQFGAIFDVEPTQVVQYSVAELRAKVMPLIPDPAAWLARLDEIYAEPHRHYEDDLDLLKSPPIVVHRFSGPVFNGAGELIGRIWTFRDVTARHRTERIGKILHQLSSFHDPNPVRVNRRVLECLSEFYGSNAILSVQDGDFLEFRDVVGPSEVLRQLPGNEVPNSYCQWVLRRLLPVRVQDGRTDKACAPRRAVRAGFTRYLGAPVFDAHGQTVGTLCLLDGKSDEPLDEEDERFVALLAMRVGAELAREQSIQLRIRDQEAVVRRQELDLETSRLVLAAMNQSLNLIGETDSQRLIQAQTKILMGVLGYESSAILLAGESEICGFLRAGERSGSPLRLDADAYERLSEVAGASSARAGGFRVLAKDASTATRKLGSRFALVAHLATGLESSGFLMLGRNEPPPLENPHHLAHVEALIEQVNLVIAAHLLHARLKRTTDELIDTRRQLIDSEKLSAVGTLAAATAHDIRNILASLSFEISNGFNDPEASLVAVRDQLDRFTVLNHRLLSYARPRMLNPMDVQLDEVVQKVISLTSAHAKLAGVRIRSLGIRRLPRIQGEPHQLEHLFVNLVLNAIQAMEPAGGQLTIRGRIRSDQISIDVCDTGKGIAKTELERLFRPFSSGRSEGFGLGLYSCRRIVEEHGGRIAVTSEPERGATFTVTLPMAQKEVERDGRKASAGR